MDVHRWINLLFGLVVGLPLITAFFCQPKDIKNCLEPSLAFLKNNTAASNDSQPGQGGLLQTAILNYFSILDKANESAFHAASVEAVLLKLDHVFSEPDLLEQACDVFKQTEKCLILKEDWCDGEIRDDLQGIENIFNMMCHQTYVTAFRANHTCLENADLEEARKGCDAKFADKLKDIGDILTKKDSTTGSEYFMVTPTETEPCKSVHAGVDCYVDKVKDTCGEEMAKWEKRLRHALVQLLLIDLNCQPDQGHFDYFEPLADESQYFVCASKEDYIPLDKHCDKTADCRDQSDEQDCDGKAWTLLDILLISIGVTAALVIVVMCVVKWREDIAFTVRHHLSLNRGREMQTFITDEEMPGESTPPPGKVFQYDQLSPGRVSSVTS